jgi:AcrR family transcriptional regulator
MPKRDNQYMSDRRDEIIDATLACLVRTGLPGLSTNAICEEAGISMGALYTHFGTKDEILLALADRSIQRRRDKLDFRSGAALRRHFLAAVESVTSEKAKGGFRVDLELIVAGSRDEKIGKALLPFRSNRDLVVALKTLQSAGELRAEVDPEAAATAIEALLLGARLLGLIGRKSAANYRHAMELLLDGVVA